MATGLDLNAHHYKGHSSTQYANVHNLLKMIAIHPECSILDIGCGHGEIIAELSQLAPYGRCVGVDPSSSMISLATDTFPERTYKNLEFYQAKAEEINFGPNTFDLVICTNALQWVRNPKKALKLMAKCLKPGGYLLILTYCKETPYVRLFESVLNKYFPELKNLSAVNTMLSIEEHKKVLERNHLLLEFFEPTQVVFEYKNGEEFKNYIKGWLTCYAPISHEQHEYFLQKVVEESNLYNISSDPIEIAIPHQRLSIKACKIET
ncbi:MAG TPA: methyltransferase domain-containing protein [Candidatus Babeliales bacterium]|nr:methyltransferase domain-containing protein [Candidatus Babeliales bacterium]